MACIYLVGTVDTKASELDYLRKLLQAENADVRLVDVSTRPHGGRCDVSAETVASHHPDGASAVLGKSDRGDAVGAMMTAFEHFCEARKDDIQAMLGIGGGGGTSIITAGMRRLPYGVPKLMVTTLAAGDTSPYLGISDLILMPSVTDLAGLNRISRVILSNAAHAIAGMASAPKVEDDRTKPPVGLTMFGVTTPAVTAITKQLSSAYDCLVFHATGTGGRMMEQLLLEGQLDGVIDMTTTEIADLLCGGVLSAGETRLDGIARTRKPCVMAPGALDMVNFQGFDSVPEKYRGRLLYRHNANVTLMRTTPEENRAIGEWIAAKLNACEGPVRLLLPEKGVSALDIEGGDFFDVEADTALFEALRDGIETNADRQVISLPLHINDPEFAAAACEHFLEITNRHTNSQG